MLKILPLTAVGLSLGLSAASADTFDNASLASPGVYFGTGNINSGFTVVQSGGVELGLEAIERYVGPVTPSGDTYDVATGNTTVAGETGAYWGVVFSVNTNYLGTSSTTLANITPSLTLTDVNNGTTQGFNLLLIPDNSLYGSSGVCSPQSACGSLSNYYAFQNSEALSFPAVAAALGDPGYDVNANDTYDFTLSLREGDRTLASDSIVVQAGTGTPVPEPFTLSLFGAGLAGAAALRRRKRAQKV